MSGQNTRLSWVDTAKGISIILVVMMYSVFNVGQDAEGIGLFHYVIGFATPFRMPEFFLISGLFLDQVLARTWRGYADRRVVHYLYFYALWAVIHIVLKIGVMSAAPAEAATDLLWAVVEPYGVLWFIYLLAAFSAVTKIFYDLKAPKWAVWGVWRRLPDGAHPDRLVFRRPVLRLFRLFLLGYIFAPYIFKLVDWAVSHKALGRAGARRLRGREPRPRLLARLRRPPPAKSSSAGAAPRASGCCSPLPERWRCASPPASSPASASPTGCAGSASTRSWSISSSCCRCRSPASG